MAEDDDLKAAYERAHELYLAFRHEIAVAMEDSEEHIEGTSAGGMPVRIKCLHALLAQTLVMGEGANPIGDMALKRFVMNSTQCMPLHGGKRRLNHIQTERRSNEIRYCCRH